MVFLLALAPANALSATKALSLDDALAEAARANPDIGVAAADARAADVEVTRSYTAFAPTVDLTAVFGYDWIGDTTGSLVATDPVTGVPTTVDATTPATELPIYALQLRARQPLFDGLRMVHEVRLARAQQRAARRSVEEARLQVALQVVYRFYEVVKAERTLAVLQKTVERSQRTVETTEALFAAGRVPKADTLAARVNLGNDRIATDGHVLRLARARHALAAALGRSDGTEVQVLAPEEVDAARTPPLPLDELVATARKQRPLYAEAQALTDAAREGVSVARARYWPTATGVATYTRQSQSLGGSHGVYGDLTQQYGASVLLVLNWNLFNAGETRAAEKRAQALVRRAGSSAQSATDGVVREIADARAAVEVLAHQVELTAANFAVAKEGLELARERFSAGRASQLEVRDASLKLTQAELAVEQARIDHLGARATLGLLVHGR